MRRWLVLLVWLTAAAAAVAVTPATWTHSTEKHFAAGEFESTGVSSAGEVALARKIDLLMTSDAAPLVVSAVAVAGKEVYAASGTSNVIYKIVAGKAEKFAEPPGAIVASLLWTEDTGLLAGTGGKNAGLYRIDKNGAVVKLWADPKVQYIWAVLPGAKGTVYAATGPEAKVFAVGGDGKAEVLHSAEKLAKNILCLARADDGRLYAGTDKEGLVIEIDPAGKTSRIIIDAPEKEIAALVLSESGGVYAATSDASKAKAGPAGPAASRVGKTARTMPSQPAGTPRTKPAGKVATSGPATRPRGKTATSAPASRPAPKHPTSRPARKVVGGISARPSGAAARAAGRRRQPAASAAKGPGNAIYHVQPDGLIRTVFRKPVTILAMIMHQEKLILATGNGGVLYAVSPDGDEVLQLADTDAKEVTSLDLGDDGRIVFATANKGSVGAISSDFAAKGTYLSQVLDAKQIARWGTLRLRSQTSPGTTVTVATRSGNVKKPDEKTWGPWCKKQSASEEFLTVLSRAARFLQYRLTLKSNGKVSPVVGEVKVVYQVGNLPPAVASVRVKAAAKVGNRGDALGAKALRAVTISAKDPNSDKIIFTLEFRQIGERTWVKIAEKLTKPQYVWDTRTVGDGKYELRVTAGDSPANPPKSALSAARISEPVVVDNTPPAFENFAAQAEGDKVSVVGTAADKISRIVAIHYSVDSADEWVAVLPDDGICDANREKFAFDLDELDGGAHRIAVRAKDLYGNVGYYCATVHVARKE